MTEYLQGHHESVLRSHRWRTSANSAAYLLPHLRPGMQLLDVGCGPGTLSDDLGSAVGPDGSVLGVDNAEEAIQAATGGTRSGNVSYQVQDIQNLDLPDDSFDVVHAHQVLQHLTDPVAALREMRRVCRPGGLVAVREADYAAMTWHPVQPGMDRWLSVYRELARARGAEPDAGRRLLGWAHRAGFDDVVATASVWCFATPEDRAWWGEMQADRVQHSRFADLATESGLSDEAGLADMAHAWRSWALQVDGWFTVLHGEVLCRLGRVPAPA